jgi:CheY-like chemotaxis protein
MNNGDDNLHRQLAESTADAQRRADQLRDLALALADAEARERKRLAQRLHDGLQQFLSAARLKAALVRRRLSPEDAESILQVERMLEQAIEESRNLTTELCPPVLYDAGLIPAVETLARSFERKHGIPIKLDLDPDAEPEAEQVRVLLFEAVRELLTNTAQHAQAKVAQIRIALSPQRHIEIVVSDDGIGFDPLAIEFAHRKDKLFGLLEIRERLTYIGGGMRLETATERGAKVTLFVPTQLRPVDPGESSPSMIPEQHELTKAREGACRIVVADDHAIFREGLINLLSQDADLKVIGEAADGAEAIDVTRKLLPDMLIVDVTMPKLNGIEVTHRLAREMPNLKIVGLSMHEREDMARAMRAAGAAAYLTKGGSSEALLSLIRNLALAPS